MAGYIFKRAVFGADEYWTGIMDNDGSPLTSPHRSDAYVFTSSSAALQTADTHRALRDSDEWKVVPR